jgi:hypothetical protein
LNQADREALRLTGKDNVDHMIHDQEHHGSLAALLSGAFHPEYESPLNLAEHALVQLGIELCVLGELLESGTDLVPNILGNYVRGLHCRATMAAEASRRIREANPAGEPACAESEAAQ